MEAKLECLRREVEDEEIEAINIDNLRHSQSLGEQRLDPIYSLVW